MKRILILAAALLAAGTACAQEAYREQRRSLFELLPIRSSDIVFLGNSLTDGCEWSELSATAASAPTGRANWPNGSIRSSKGIPSGCS